MVQDVFLKIVEIEIAGNYVLSIDTVNPNALEFGLKKEYENGNIEVCIFSHFIEFSAAKRSVKPLYLRFLKLADSDYYELRKQYVTAVTGNDYRIGNLTNPSFGELCSPSETDAVQDIDLFDSMFLKGTINAGVGMNHFHKATIKSLTGW